MMWTLLYFGIIATYFSKNANSDFLPIKWNDSTDVGFSQSERLQEYSMFTDIATCDLTGNFCDSGCCVDPDCDEEQRKTFNCSRETNLCSRPFSHYDCNCNSERPYWFPVLCYVFENPIYLGTFHKALGKIENLKNFVDLTSRVKYKFRPAEKVEEKNSYVFGSQVLAYIYQNDSYTPYPHALFHEGDMISGLSFDCFIPVKYLKNEQYTCYVELTEERCQNGVSLGVRPYLLQNENSGELKDIPVVLKNLVTEEKADVNITFKYITSNYIIKKFGGKLYKYFYSNNIGTDQDYDKNLLNTFLSNSVCFNIVTRATVKLSINGSEINKIEMDLYLTNVPLSNSYETNYIKRVHDVNFVIVNDRSESVDDNYSYNRGYYIGEELNFGYIWKNESLMNWEKGHLKIFFNGGSCNRSRVVLFGYNTYSVCLHSIRHSKCSQVRDEITHKMESLTLGEYLAPYGNYRNPQRSAVPLLRNYNETSSLKNNESDCLIPIKQDLFIQYVTGITAEGFTVYEAVGAMINRSFVSVTNEDVVSLIMNVVFIDTTPSRKKPLSRFWERMYSPEESENAWLNIFNVFDRSVSDRELEESTFWFILPIILCVVIFLLRIFR